MSYAVEFFLDGQRICMGCDVRGAELPVRLRGGNVRMYLWGAGGDSHRVGDLEPGNFYKWPEGGHVRLEVVRRGDWWQLKPQPVKVAVAGFLVRNNALAVGIEQWVKLRPGQFIQGALCQKYADYRVYVVTVDPPPECSSVADPWPRIVQIGGKAVTPG